MLKKIQARVFFPKKKIQAIIAELEAKKTPLQEEPRGKTEAYKKMVKQQKWCKGQSYKSIVVGDGENSLPP